MPWFGRYYYRSVRVNGEPRRQYVGTGLVGQLADKLDAVKRERQALGRVEAALASVGAETLDADLRAVDELADALARAALVAAGYHRHNRGPWRRKRESR